MLSFGVPYYFIAVCWLNLVAGHSSHGFDSPQEVASASDGNGYLLLNLGNTAGIDKRQTLLPTRHNISQIVTPLATGRWIASIDSQLQVSSQTDASKISCTLSICTGPLICGARQAIGMNWETLSLKVSLRANQPQLISFITNCSAPAYVGLRNMVIPGLGQALASTVTSTRTMTFTAPPELSTITETETKTLPPILSTTTMTVDPTPGPIQTFTIPVVNECEDSSVVLVSAPNNPDFMVIDATDRWRQYPVEVASANQSLSFTPLNGRNLCTFHTFDEYYHCDWVGQPQTVPDRESLTLTCPEASNSPVQPPDSSGGTSNVNIQIGRTCPHIVTQMGCSRYETCIQDAYSNETPDVSFVYPWRARFRVKAVGLGWTRAQWSVSYADSNYGGPWSYDQLRGTWLDITPPFANTGLISIVVECKTTEEIQVRMYSTCPDTVIFGAPDAWDWDTLQPSDERTFYLEKENPTASLTPLRGERLCAKIERTAVEYCDYETLSFGTMLDQDVIQITCPGEFFPPQVDVTGETIDLFVETSSTTMNLALQIDCVPGNPCSAYSSDGGSHSFSVPYPVTSPTTRLRVRAYGSLLPSHMFYAEWSVQFSGGLASILIQANTEYLDITVPEGATSIHLYGSAFFEPRPEPTPEPTVFSINAANNCLDSADALIGVPRESDLFLAPANRGSFPMGYVLYSDDPRVIFTSLTGRQMCAVVIQTGARSCGTDDIVVPDLRQDDFLELQCPDAPPPLPVSDRTIKVHIATSETSPNLVVQFGCEQPGGPCFSYTTGLNADQSLDYPVLKPMLRLRVRVFASIGNGQKLSHVEWQVAINISGNKGPQLSEESYVQQKGQWLDILVPSDAIFVNIFGNGIENREEARVAS